MARRLVTLPGSKASLASLQANYLPVGGFSKSWETNAGTCAFTNNILSGLKLKEMYATELDVGTYCLLKVCKENPVGLIRELRKTEYSMEEYERAEDVLKCIKTPWDELKIAVAKYVLLRQSMNGAITSYRDIDKSNDCDLKSWISAQQHRDRYHRQIIQLAEYSDGLQGLKIIQGDMLKYFDRFAADSDMFIYSDIPYTNGLRADRLYREETDAAWHRKYAKKLAEMTRDGTLKAKMMLCNYVSVNLESDVYCKELLKEGWTLYFIKDVYRPTVIKQNSKSRKKNKTVEAIFLNYQPLNPTVGKNRIFTYEDVFG